MRRLATALLAGTFLVSGAVVASADDLDAQRRRRPEPPPQACAPEQQRLNNPNCTVEALAMDVLEPEADIKKRKIKNGKKTGLK